MYHYCAGLPAQPDQLVAIKQLEAIKDAYQAAPSNLRSRFQHLFLNVVDNPASRVKPDGSFLRHCLVQLSSAPASSILYSPTCCVKPGIKPFSSLRLAPQSRTTEYGRPLTGQSLLERG